MEQSKVGDCICTLPQTGSSSHMVHGDYNFRPFQCMGSNHAPITTGGGGGAYSDVMVTFGLVPTETLTHVEMCLFDSTSNI